MGFITGCYVTKMFKTAVFDGLNNDKEMSLRRFNALFKSKIAHFLWLLFLLYSGRSMAANSWYLVDNYEGFIGKYAVHLSIQYYDFGEKNKIEGVYYYDKYNSLIALYGRQIANEIILCEASELLDLEKYTMEGERYDLNLCPFRMHKNDANLSGIWKRGDAKLDVKLTYASSIVQNKIVSDKGYVEIPFWGQSKRHAFIGMYEAGDDGVLINKFRVIEKKSGQTIQTLNPQSGCAMASLKVAMGGDIVGEA